MDTVEAAQQAGLVTFDDSNGWLWLHDGKFLPRAHAAEWRRFVKEVRKGPRALTRAELVKDLEAQVRRLLEPHGWVFRSAPETVRCQRVLPAQGVRQSFSLHSLESGGDCRFYIEVRHPSLCVHHDAFDRAVQDLQARRQTACRSS